MRTPNDGKKYWYIKATGEIDWYNATGGCFDEDCFNLYNFFNTKKEAQEALKKIKELLLSLKK